MMAENLTVSYAVLGVYLLLVAGSGVLGAFFQWRSTVAARSGTGEKHTLVREHFMAGTGLAFIAWFFSMAASLFSGYSVTGIVNEAFTTGWAATRWIPAGVGVYVGFMFLAPRCHALGKQRGYMTISELIYDRFVPPSGSPLVAHLLRLGSFACLQLPIFTYLITQFRSVGIEVEAFTAGGIDNKTAVLVAAGLLLLCDLMGGMRAVAYSDVLQGAVLFIGSIIFLVIQKTELGGMPEAFSYWTDPANLKAPRVANMYFFPNRVTVVSYFDFVFKTTVAATMFPHLCQRLFCSRTATNMKKGLAYMNFTFFIVQLSSMITGWVAINALSKAGKVTSAFGITLKLVAESGGGQAFCSALLLASALCAMMSTADSALLAFSTMWVRDLLKPYLWKSASDWSQVLFGKVMAVIGLAVGVSLSLLTINTGKPNLSGLFSLQNVTPIHVVPAVWLGLHWRGLRGEAVLAGMVCGLGVTLGLVFSDKNVKYAIGDDMLANGLSSSWVGFCVNMFVTVTLGLAMQFGPRVLRRQPAALPPVTAPTDDVKAVDAAVKALEAEAASTISSSTAESAHAHHLDIGPKHDTLISWKVMVPIFLCLLFSVPFYYNSKLQQPNMWVGNMATWAFTSLFISGLLAIAAAYGYLFMWADYQPLPLLPYNRQSSAGGAASSERGAAASAAAAADTTAAPVQG